jgi:FkbM family methyltransferase
VSALRHFATHALVRPYVWRELPGWGKAMQLVNQGREDKVWQHGGSVVMRGKLHGLLLNLDLRTWSNRVTWFLGRYYDLGTQLLVGGLLEPGDLFVDIGANEGMIALVGSLTVGDSGKVIAFEPNPAPRQVFERNLADNHITNVEIIPAGASDAPGMLELHVHGINTGGGSFAVSGDTPSGDLHIVTCPVAVPDVVLECLSPSLVKIDVEGFESHVLAGLAHTIERARPTIVMEMIADHLARAGSAPGDICDSMAAHGYRGYRMRLSGPTASQRLDLEALGAGDWQDGDVVWIAADRVEAQLLVLRGFGVADLQAKWQRT